MGDDHVDDWIRSLRARGRLGSDKTEAAYRADLARWAEAIDGPVTPSTPPARWEAVLDSWANDLADSTRARRCSTLRTYLTWLSSRLGQQAPDLSGVTVSVNRRRLPVVLDDGELDRIRVAVASPPSKRRQTWPTMERALMLSMLDGLLRADEAAGARVSDLSLRGRSLRVEGKGAKERSVPLTGALHDALAAYLPARARIAAADQAALFVRPDGSAFTSNRVTRIVERWFTDADIERRPGAVAHAFRHTGAVRWDQSGLPISMLRVMLGHESLDTTTRYLAVSNRMVAERIDVTDAPSTRQAVTTVDDLDGALDKIAGDEAVREAHRVLAAAIEDMPSAQAALATLTAHSST